MCLSARRRQLGSSAAALVAALVAGTACFGDSYQPPSRSSSVRAEEVRLAGLIEQHERAGFGGVQGQCNVRFLGSEGSTAFAWANCSFPPTSGSSTAYRIEGSTVIKPGDGSAFAASVKRMFPQELADAILHDREALRPSEP